MLFNGQAATELLLFCMTNTHDKINSLSQCSLPSYISFWRRFSWFLLFTKNISQSYNLIWSWIMIWVDSISRIYFPLLYRYSIYLGPRFYPSWYFYQYVGVCITKVCYSGADKHSASWFKKTTADRSSFLCLVNCRVLEVVLTSNARGSGF